MQNRVLLLPGAVFIILSIVVVDVKGDCLTSTTRRMPFGVFRSWNSETGQCLHCVCEQEGWFQCFKISCSDMNSIYPMMEVDLTGCLTEMGEVIPFGTGRIMKYRNCSRCDCMDPYRTTCGSVAHCEPVNGGFTPFTSWTKCSASCDGGTQSHSRTCTNPVPKNGGEVCKGALRESQACNTHPCRVDGGWTEFTDWSSCTVTCGGGKSSRSRTCTNPSPQMGGKDCTGKATGIRLCNTRRCPIVFQLKCSRTGFTVRYPKKLLRFHRASDLRLMDPRCRAKDDGYYYTFTSSLKGCGTRSFKMGKTVVFKNAVSTVMQRNQIITRRPLVRKPIICLFKNEDVIKSPSVIRNHLPPLGNAVEEVRTAGFDVFLELLDKNRREARDGASAKVTAQDKDIHFAVFSNAKDVTVSPRRCSMTTSPRSNGVYYHDLIPNACSSANGVEYRGPYKNGQRYSFKSSLLAKDPGKPTYLHCDIAVCSASVKNSICVHNCGDDQPNQV